MQWSRYGDKEIKSLLKAYKTYMLEFISQDTLYVKLLHQDGPLELHNS